MAAAAITAATDRKTAVGYTEGPNLILVRCCCCCETIFSLVTCA